MGGLATEPGAVSFATYVVTYNRPSTLRRTVEVLLAQTAVPELIFVVDNGDADRTEQVLRGLDDRVVHHRASANLGPAGGMAVGMLELRRRGFDWVHFVDDDDPPPTVDTIERLQALIARHDGPTLGAVAAIGSWWDWETGESQRIPDDRLHGDIEVDTVGGSGQLTVKGEVIDALGTTDERYFWGYEDLIYCLRLRADGYQVMIDGDLARDVRTAAGRMGYTRQRAVVPRHSHETVWRRYYSTRNYIHWFGRECHRSDLARREAGKALIRSAAAWRRGPHYGARFTRLQLRAVIDGYRGNLGRTVEPPLEPASKV